MTAQGFRESVNGPVLVPFHTASNNRLSSEVTKAQIQRSTACTPTRRFQIPTGTVILFLPQNCQLYLHGLWHNGYKLCYHRPNLELWKENRKDLRPSAKPVSYSPTSKPEEAHIMVSSILVQVQLTVLVRGETLGGGRNLVSTNRSASRRSLNWGFRNFE